MKNASDRKIRRVKLNKRLIIIRIMNFINCWKRKIDKVKKRRIYRYGKNVQSTLNLTVKEQYSINDTAEQTSATAEHVLDDNVAIENQVKLVSFKPVGSRRSRRYGDGCLELRSTNTTHTCYLEGQEGDYKNEYKPTPTCCLVPMNKQRYRDVYIEKEELERSFPINKPLKRINSHSEEYGHIYKKINWQDWTMSDPTKHYNTYNYKKPSVEINAPSILIEGVACGSPTDDSVFTSLHSEMTFERVSRMYLDFDADDISTSTDDPDNKENNNDRYLELKFPDRNSGDSNKPHFAFADFYRSSLRSYDESHRGSIQSRTSISSNHKRSSPVPMNFIPGQTKPMTKRERYASIPFNDIQKATFCFKGVTCQVERSKPRTDKALVHMGMMIISILGPTAHKCSH